MRMFSIDFFNEKGVSAALFHSEQCLFEFHEAMPLEVKKREQRRRVGRGRRLGRVGRGRRRGVVGDNGQEKSKEEESVNDKAEVYSSPTFSLHHICDQFFGLWGPASAFSCPSDADDSETRVVRSLGIKLQTIRSFALIGTRKPY